MATIFRPPLYTRVAAREWDRALRSQPHRGSSTALLIAGTNNPAFTERLWPNPQIPRWSVALRTWLSPSTYQLISLGPVAGFVWLDGLDRKFPQTPMYLRNTALLNTQVNFPFQNEDQPNPAQLQNKAAWAFSVAQRNMQTQPPNPGAPKVAGNAIAAVNPVRSLWSPNNYGSVAGLNALPLTPPPVGTAARQSGLYIGITRIGF